MWTSEDEALLLELQDRALIQSLFRVHTGDPNAKITQRAVALIEELRQLPKASEALQAASRGDLAPLVGVLEAPPPASASARCLHCIAVYLRQVAELMQRVASEAHRTDLLRLRAAQALEMLTADSYLEDQARKLDPIAQAGDASQIAELARTSILEDAGAQALAGSATRTVASARALAWLATLTTTLAPNSHARRRAEALATKAIEAALEPLADQLRQARGNEHAERLIFAEVRTTWEWAGHDEAVERFAVDQMSDIAWAAYRKEDWTQLRNLLDPCMALFDNLARRIEAEPLSKLAYAAKCAQSLVFASEANPSRAESLALAERALRICPTHRNARVVVSHVLCEQAIATLSRGMLVRATDVDEAARNVDRVEKLFPQLRRLPEARKLLEAARRQRT